MLQDASPVVFFSFFLSGLSHMSKKLNVHAGDAQYLPLLFRSALPDVFDEQPAILFIRIED